MNIMLTSHSAWRCNGTDHSECDELSIKIFIGDCDWKCGDWCSLCRDKTTVRI